MKRWRWPLLLFLISFIPVVAIYHSLYSRLDLPEGGYRLEIARGDSFNSVIDRLAAEGVIPERWLPRVWLRLQAGNKSLHPGVFLLRPPQNTVSLLRQVLQGNVVGSASRLTVVEGMAWRDLRRQLAIHELVTAAGELDDAAILRELGASATTPEGLFAPDTYDIAPGESELSVLRRLYQRQMRILDEEWGARAPDLPYASPYEALIMASIVEKETGVAHERAQIAGVFVRRLQIGMRLQTDPTVIYGMGESYEGRLRRADLQRMTPYNTYRINGLPPSPIALPGRDAIHAALHPLPGKALYFVARGDGSHEFSATLAEHNRAVERYQKRRRADYRSAPGS
ncbi:MAG: endolytic transglycosylase MltG [Moraxellaceae bacterium]|nr:endolytic transglycosylase MltG [Moraxellaceae bacterium]